MKSLAFLLSVSALVSATLARIHVGPCPDISGKIVSVPDLSPFTGKWYEIQKFNNFFERGLECNYAEYSLSSDGTYINVNNTGYNGESYTSQVGKATQPTPPLGAFIVTFGVNPITPSTPNYNLLALDTSSYALIYSCFDVFNIGGIEYSWILSREPTISASVLESLTGNLTALGVDVSNFVLTDQTNCP